MSQMGGKKRCWFLTPYLHWREEAPYWKRHCSSASYTCPGATVGYRKSRFRGSLSRHVPRPELSKKQTYNSIVSCNKETFLHLHHQQVYIGKRCPPLSSHPAPTESSHFNTIAALTHVLGGRSFAVIFYIDTFPSK